MVQLQVASDTIVHFCTTMSGCLRSNLKAPKILAVSFFLLISAQTLAYQYNHLFAYSFHPKESYVVIWNYVMPKLLYLPSIVIDAVAIATILVSLI